MNRLFAVAVATAMLASMGAASADESAGKIKSVDQTKKELVLEDGTVFTLGDKVMIKELKPGQDVTVSYEMKNGHKQADTITVKK